MNDCREVSAATYFAALCYLTAASPAAAGVDYTRDVRPILSQHCFKCHGPDDAARKAGLRLDLANTIVAEKDENELLRRIHADDEAEVMPPPSTKKPLSHAQKETLKKWIAEGAEYQSHWSFAPPKSVAPPKVKRSEWPRTPIDAFILAKLEAENLAPSPEADRYTLARRVSLDLIGLPPTPAELDAFVNDSSPDAYERYVDRLLASPRYGERWARRWLDLARYADTNGYEKDRIRSIWPYRDWVVNALNADKPYDQFSIEQLAGDMLPNSELTERIATGFHRNTMINEEGGIDPLEFRYHAVADRVGVTANVWMGLTFQCAQCHTHKFDPITHRDYFGMFAYLDNAEEPVMEVWTPEQERRRKEIEAEIERRSSVEELLKGYVINEGCDWRPATIESFRSTSGVGVEILTDNSVRLTPNKKVADKDDYIVALKTDGPVDAIRLETLADPKLPNRGPGLTPHGNFVLTEFAVSSNGKPVSLTALAADVTQHEFSPAATLDKNHRTGWAVDVGAKRNADHYIDYALPQPIASPTPIAVRIEQRYGGGHVVGKFRVLFGKRRSAAPIAKDERGKLINRRFNDWAAQEARNAVQWTELFPTRASATTAWLETLKLGFIRSHGDIAKSETYTIRGMPQTSSNQRITAIRLETFADPNLPGGGPGRVYYEGPLGEFFLSEFTVSVGGKPVKIKSATADYSAGVNTPTAALDGDQQTGWSINGGQGNDHRAVFVLKTPVAATELEVKMLFERYYAAPLGLFRLSVCYEPNPKATLHPDEIESLLVRGKAANAEARGVALWKYYLSQAPETAAARAEIDKLKAQIPKPATTLVMEERKLAPRRVTQRRHRGEYLQPKEAVNSATPSALPQPSDLPKDRLAFAKWLLGEENPLGDRVAVNRQWSAFFGRGLVRTQEDFGGQGEVPSHPELLDWLAASFRRSGMSMKKLHRLIVASAVYRQSSRIAPELMARDADNKLLGRFPSVRLEAEVVRDSMLQAAGLLSQKMLGPSVFPPQPPGVSSEGAYGPLAWKESQGEDRYRRALYTFSKRTAPYALFATFDAPSGEACVVRREVSNTPLQALSTLNDRAVIEASQAVGRWAAAQKGTPAEIVQRVFLRCLGRSATPEESAKIAAFFENQKKRLAKGELDGKKLAGGGVSDPTSAAAWTAVARAVFNLHEAVVKG